MNRVSLHLTTSSRWPWRRWWRWWVTQFILTRGFMVDPLPTWFETKIQKVSPSFSPLRCALFCFHSLTLHFSCYNSVALLPFCPFPFFHVPLGSSFSLLFPTCFWLNYSFLDRSIKPQFAFSMHLDSCIWTASRISLFPLVFVSFPFV